MSRPVSRVLFCIAKAMSFHHLSGPVITERLWRPTPPDFARIRASSPVSRRTGKSEYTWSYNPQVCTAHGVTTMTGELLPHLFTLTLTNTCQGGYFLFQNYVLTDIFPLGSMVLCVARTFLLPHSRKAMERPAAMQK